MPEDKANLNFTTHALERMGIRMVTKDMIGRILVKGRRRITDKSLLILHEGVVVVLTLNARTVKTRVVRTLAAGGPVRTAAVDNAEQ